MSLSRMRLTSGTSLTRNNPKITRPGGHEGRKGKTMSEAYLEWLMETAQEERDVWDAIERYNEQEVEA